MKYLRYFLPIIIVVLSTTLAFSQSGTKDGTFDAAGLDEFFIKVNSGIDIEIEGTATNQISYTYSFEGNDEAYQKYFEEFNPRFNKRAGRAELEIEYPEEKNNNVSYEIEKNLLTLQIPEQVRLHLTTEYATIGIQNIGRDVSVYNRSGSVTVEDVGQSVEVTNEYGDISVRNVRGRTNINGRSSTIDVANITGMVSVRSSYSKLNISNIDGDVEIQNKSGAINAFEIRGKLQAEADYSEFEITNIEGAVDLRSQSGNVYVEAVRGFNFAGDYTDVRVNNVRNAAMVMINGRSADITVSNIEANTSITGEYMNVKASNISRRLSIMNRSGTVEAANISERFDFNGEYTDLELTKFQGNELQIRSKSGSVSVDALSNNLNADIGTEYGNIELKIPNAFNGSFEATATYGTINHNLTLSNKQLTSDNNSRRISGIVGDSGKNSSHGIFLEVRNGDITVQAN
ncbi:DUF4097 family beta strand repeat-containing protein [Gracilimonas sp.]|uniref:DUF4097 family beta strand repeat-containing protein n=1 Tax=Gracilimonas sp. TaxID=1974203 RepID=UPI002872A46A|nr:DUF4097 family beta strand repeat-containing protein [Gracilimonas sp.]